MTVINLRPVGWDSMTPRQWGTLRELIRLVRETALRSSNPPLLMRAHRFLTMTAGRDV